MTNLSARAPCYRNEVLDCVSRGIPKLNYTSSLSENKHPYPQESKLNASEKITHAHTRAHMFRSLSFSWAIPHERRGAVRVSHVLSFFLFFFFAGEEGGHLGRQKRTLCLPQETPGTRWNFDLPCDRSNLHVFLPRGKRYCLRTIAEAAIVQGFDETSPTPPPRAFVLLLPLPFSLCQPTAPRVA